jgi:hypothetical protein
MYDKKDIKILSRCDMKIVNIVNTLLNIGRRFKHDTNHYKQANFSFTVYEYCLLLEVCMNFKKCK